MKILARSACTAAILFASCAATLAQAPSATCQRLEAQLAAVERGSADPARAEQARRYEDAANKQQFELDKLVAQARRQGCEQRSGFFSALGQSMFGGGDGGQCAAVERRIDQMRINLDRMQAEAQQSQGTNLERGEQRRGILMALTDNNCGPQYRSASQGGRGFFDQLFGGNDPAGMPEQTATGARTICVRMCDGYYFPANASRAQDGDQACQRLCPAAEVALYSQRPGEDVAHAVSLSGQPYSSLPAAFKYRTQFDPSCSCRKTGQSWAEALKQVEDTTVEQGDIIVDDKRAKTLSQPRSDAQGRTIKPESRSNKTDAKADVTGTTPKDEEKAAEAEKPKGPIRSVGAPFIPAR